MLPFGRWLLTAERGRFDPRLLSSARRSPWCKPASGTAAINPLFSYQDAGDWPRASSSFGGCPAHAEPPPTFSVDDSPLGTHTTRMESIALLVTAILGFLSMLFAIVRTTSTLRRDIRGDIGRLEGRMDRLDGRMDGFDGRMDRLGDRLDRRIDALQASTDGLQGRMDGLQGRMDTLQSRMDGKFDALRADLEHKLESGFLKMHDDHRDLRGRLDRITDNLALRGLIPTEQ